MIQDASPELIPQLLYQIENGLTRIKWFVLGSANTIASSESDMPVIGCSERI